MVELSVVIPMFNGAAVVEHQLCALMEQIWDGEWEILVVDNGSTDGSQALVELIAQRDGRVRLVDAQQIRGAAHARNIGAAEARGANLAFCDADDEVAAGWLAAVAASLTTSTLVTGPQQYERLNPAWTHGVFGTQSGREMQRFVGIFPFGPSANLGISKALFEELGGFDTSLLIGEDIDLCMRAWIKGVDLQFIRAAAVHYRYRKTMRGLWCQAVGYGVAVPEIARRLARNSCETPSRWTGARNWLWLLRSLPALRSRAGRAKWIVVAGASMGRVIGSCRSRYVVL